MFNNPFLKSILTMVAGVVLVGGLSVQAADKASTFDADKPASREEALALTKEKKADARHEASAAMEKELTPLEKDWGVRLYGIRWTAGGYMLEMKLRILDEHKAFPLLKRDIKRYLIVGKDGSVLEVPFTQKLGSLKSTVRTANMVKADRNYIALFANPGQHAKRGDKVTLVIGNFIAEDLTIE